MKLSVTKKEIAEYSNVFKLGYCALQNYLNRFDCIAYTSGSRYGWEADLYKIKRCINEEERTFTQTFYICTGHYPTGNLKLSSEAEKKLYQLDEELKRINFNSYTEEKAIINKMTNIFLRELSEFYEKKLGYTIESYLPE